MKAQQNSEFDSHQIFLSDEGTGAAGVDVGTMVLGTFVETKVPRLSCEAAGEIVFIQLKKLSD